MKKSGVQKGALKVVIPLLVLSFSVFVFSCQKDEVNTNTDGQDVALKGGVTPGITLVYPESAVPAGTDFEITYSSTCGKTMIDRGYVNVLDEVTGLYTKVYTGLTCDSEGLLWECVGPDVYSTCSGATITGNLAVPGTYVYRMKLNFKAVKKSDCPECAGFSGNQVTCFVITVVEATDDQTFTDARDGHVYKMVQIGDQVWMAENLAYIPESGSMVPDADHEAVYGRWYDSYTAMAGAGPSDNVPSGIQGICPDGWHLPSSAEWGILTTSLGGIDVAGGKMKTTGTIQEGTGLWQAPNGDATNESGFSGLPGGMWQPSGGWGAMGFFNYWWGTSQYPGFPEIISCASLSYSDGKYVITHLIKNTFVNVRCIRN